MGPGGLGECHKDKLQLLVHSTQSQPSETHSWEVGHRAHTFSPLPLRALMLTHRKGDNETETKKSPKEKQKSAPSVGNRVQGVLTGCPGQCAKPAGLPQWHQRALAQ